MKRLIFALVTIFVFCGLSVSADTVTIDNTNPQPGDEITLSFVIDNEITTSAQQFRLHYNAEFFEYIGYENGVAGSKLKSEAYNVGEKSYLNIVAVPGSTVKVCGKWVDLKFKVLKKPIYSGIIYFETKNEKGSPDKITWDIPKLGGFGTEIKSVECVADTAKVTAEYKKNMSDETSAMLYVASYEGNKLIDVKRKAIPEDADSGTLTVENLAAKNYTMIKAMILKNEIFKPLSIPAEYINGGN